MRVGVIFSIELGKMKVDIEIWIDRSEEFKEKRKGDRGERGRGKEREGEEEGEGKGAREIERGSRNEKEKNEALMEAARRRIISCPFFSQGVKKGTSPWFNFHW